MTIRNRQQADDYNDFRYGCEKAPEGTFEDAKAILATLSEMMDGMEAPAKALGLKVSNSDGAFEIEAAMFDMLRTENPDRQIEAAIGLGASHHSRSRTRPGLPARRPA